MFIFFPSSGIRNICSSLAYVSNWGVRFRFRFRLPLLYGCWVLFRHGSELSSSSKTRVFVSGFRSSKKFEVRTKVREPDIFDFSKKKQNVLNDFFNFVLFFLSKLEENIFSSKLFCVFLKIQATNIEIFFEKFENSVRFGSVRVRGSKLDSFKFGTQKLGSNRVREKAVRTHVYLFGLFLFSVACRWWVAFPSGDTSARNTTSFRSPNLVQSGGAAVRRN